MFFKRIHDRIDECFREVSLLMGRVDPELAEAKQKTSKLAAEVKTNSLLIKEIFKGIRDIYSTVNDRDQEKRFNALSRRLNMLENPKYAAAVEAFEKAKERMLELKP
jgi:uncharacterized protein YoxC